MMRLCVKPGRYEIMGLCDVLERLICTNAENAGTDMTTVVCGTGASRMIGYLID